MNIGRKVRALRLEKGLSQRQLAGKEMTRGFVSMLERGRTRPSDRTLRILARRLGKPAGFFRRPSSKDNAGVVRAAFEGTSKKSGTRRTDEAISILEQVVETCRGAYLLAEARLLLATLQAKGRYAG